ncbi:MAG: ABC transporter permease [Cyclobacteriaceae bacterium]|jgi:ABC-type lipoprotein release transport system permease subunit|nr:ABC transporter permease [Cyclobacteriaceae bacterium]
MIIQMAWRNIWRNKVRSIVIMASIALGLVAGLFILGLYEGILKSRLKTVIEEEVSHLQIHNPSFKMDYEAVYSINQVNDLTQKIFSLGNIKALSVRSIAQGMLATSTGSSGVQINGVYPDHENQVSQLNKKIKEGDGFTAGKRNQILIGRKLADKVKLSVGNKLVLTFTDKEFTIVSAAFRVAGIYQTDNAPLDERNVYVQADDLNRLLVLEDECHEIAILLDNDQALDTVEQQLKAAYPDLLIENWKQVSPETQLMIETTDTYSIIFIVIIMLALMFGIINTMLMAVLERTREIGMLVALGMNKLRLFVLVLWETILLTLAGAPFGFLVAWMIIRYYGKTGIDISSFAGEAMSGFGFSSLFYPEFPWTKLLTVLYIVCCTALVASLFPSYKALRLVPVEAMRQ